MIDNEKKKKDVKKNHKKGQQKIIQKTKINKHFKFANRMVFGYSIRNFWYLKNRYQLRSNYSSVRIFQFLDF